MGNESYNLWSIVIPSAVTILGLVITYLIAKRSLKDEINKLKTNIQLEEMTKVPVILLEFYDKLVRSASDPQAALEVVQNEYMPAMARIFAYGTIDAIKISSSMQEHSYKLASLEGNAENEKFKSIPYTTLLVCQIKFDLTHVIINPEYWYKMKINDYNVPETKMKIIEANNNIVAALNLDRRFIVP